MAIRVRFVTGHVCVYNDAEHVEFTPTGWIEAMTCDPKSTVPDGALSKWVASIRGDAVLAVETSDTSVSESIA